MSTNPPRLAELEGAPPLYRWTTDRFEALIATGTFAHARVELLDGFIAEKMTVGSVHAYVTRRIRTLFTPQLAEGLVLGSQEPIRLSDVSRPEPDAWIARGPDSAYRASLPTPRDLLVVVEVSDSTLEYDRGPKRELYAAAGVVEHWVVNVEAAEVERYRQPRADGTYASRQVFRRGDSVASVGAAKVRVSVDALFD